MISQRLLVSGTLATVAATLIPASIFARTFNLSYRICMQQVVDQREVNNIDSERIYDQAVVTALQLRRQQYFAAWNNTDDSAMRTAVRNADKAYRDAINAAKRDLKTREKDIKNQYNSHEKTCKSIGQFSSSSRSSSSHSN